MKKIIALFMALIMIMMLCCPAFAQNLTDKPGSTGEVIITTDTKDADGNDAEWYEVTIPADSVVLSVGYKPAPVAEKGKHIHVVGDAKKVGNLRTVIWGAWDVCMKL